MQKNIFSLEIILIIYIHVCWTVLHISFKEFPYLHVSSLILNASSNHDLEKIFTKQKSCFVQSKIHKGI